MLIFLTSSNIFDEGAERYLRAFLYNNEQTKRSEIDWRQKKVFPMTLDGKAKLENELQELKTVKRKEVVERIKIARSFGDLSENSEYDSAKDEQAFVEGRITTIENMIRNAQIIDAAEAHNGLVTLGNTVTFIELPDGEEETYTIVGSAEADPFEGKISNDSPIAKGLLGHKEGEEVTIQTPAGDMSVKIEKITAS